MDSIQLLFRHRKKMGQVKHIVLLPGDGVGPEVIQQAKRVLEAVAKTNTNIEFTFSSHLIGGCALDSAGTALPKETLDACKNAAAVMLGAVGGPQWPRAGAKSDERPEQGLLALRKGLDLFANIRPCLFPGKTLMEHSPLKSHIIEGVKFTVVRELTGGIYFGKRMETTNGVAWDTMEYSEAEVRRITRVAASLSMLSTPPLPITSIDKANVLASSRLWRKVVTETIQQEFPSVPLSHNLVDSAAMHMLMNPRKLNGIILTENMFGDILSDEASVIPGSLGLLPSASLNGWGSKSLGVYEPIHGSAPDIAGHGTIILS